MNIKRLTPHLIALAVILLVSAVFFAPNAFNGKVLPQSDNDKARAIQTEIFHYLEKDGKTPLWTNSTFGGMPSFQIYAPVKGNLTTPFLKTLFLWTDSSSVWVQVFVAMLCMYFLIIVLGADWRVAVFGALAFGITTYNMDILEAGHSTKMTALAISPALMAALVMVFNGRLLLGGGLLAFFLSMQIYANHLQITYYMLLLMGIYMLAQGIDAIRHKALLHWGKGIGIVAVAIGLGFFSNLSRVWPTYEYSEETIRGKSELQEKSAQGDGLGKEYLFGWSYGLGESLTLLVPHAYGGGSMESIQEGKFYDMISRGRSSAEKNQVGHQIASYLYWGDQPFVGTAIYFGAIICFLFALGAFLVPGNVKWWLTTGGLFFISLALGKNFFLNDLWYDYLPMFKKFRAVSMALGPGQMCFAILSALGLQKLFDADIPLQKKKQALLFGVGITGLFCLFTMLSGAGVGRHDEELANQIKEIPNLGQMLKDDRSSLATSDALRSLGFILAAAGLLWLALLGRLKAGLAVMAVAGLSLVDNWLICGRTISSGDYQTKRSVLAPPREEAYDKQIKQDKDIDYRVLDLARGGVTTNATASYFHKSLSGYHAAKLQRYQEVIDTFLGADIGRNLHIVGMLNGKYIVTPKGDVIPNEKACGNAWFVRSYKTVPTAEAEIAALHALDPKTEAVFQASSATSLEGLTIQPDTTASIRLTSYNPDKMEYEYTAKTEQLAIFSEIYYPPAKGWKCYINDKPAPDFIKGDYLLRAMRLPAGDHVKLEMRFEPRSYYLGEKVSLAASILTFLLLIAGLWFWYQKRQPSDPNRLDDIEPAPEERPIRATSAQIKGKKKK
jgi:hypothetical protein